MKKRVLALMLLFTVVFAGACAQPQDQGGAGAGLGQSPDPLFNEDGVVAYVGGTIFESSLDPIKGGMSYGYSFTNCALLRVKPDSGYEGDMAIAWTVSDDALVYTFELRQGVTFSDGSAFTADDVVFTYQTVQANQANNENVDLTKLSAAEALDDYTVRFTLAEPYSPFLDAAACLGIVPSDSYDSARFDRYPIGTGAWIVCQYDPNQQIIVEANEHYYEGPPAIKKVTFVALDSQAAFASARSGQLDIVMAGPNYAAETVPGMSLERFATMDIRMISLPVRPLQTLKNAAGEDLIVGNDVTADISVRQALAIGLDRQTIIDHAFNGVGRPAFSFTANLEWAETGADPDNRQDEAQALLTAAGWQDQDGDGIREKAGISCAFDVYAPGGDQDRFLLASAVAEDALKLGVKITVKTASWDQVGSLQHTAGIVWGWGQYSPTVLKSLFQSDLFLSGGYDNVVGYANPAVDLAIAQAFSAVSRPAAVAAWQEAQALANQDYPYLYLVNIEHCYFIRDGLDVALETQIPHPHGHGSPIICNMKDWRYR